MTNTIPIYQVNAFTHQTHNTYQAFTGNPAAVCLLKETKNADWMQSIAAEMNLSETAFVQKSIENGQRSFDLRWFTPTKEVNLCGHATLATAHILWQQKWLQEDEPAKFYTHSGELIATKHSCKIKLDFPAIKVIDTEIPAGLLQALGLSSATVFSCSEDYLVQLEDETTLHHLQPDFAALARINARGIIVTALSNNSHYDFISRFFAPAYGINEDPVTGSAHCALAPFWAERLNKNSFHAFQDSPRGGEIDVELQSNRVFLSGTAMTLLGGQLYV